MRLSWNLPLERFSATSLSTAISCPEQFRQKYIVRERDSDIMFGSRFLGIVDHKMNEAVLSAKINGLDFDFDKSYQDIWNRTISKHGEPDWRDDDPLKMMQTGIKMARAYHTQVDVRPVATEERFEIEVPGVPVPIIGYIDTIERDKIRERKTTDVKRTKPKSGWRFQGLIYQYAKRLPVQWDVVTRQVTPQVFTADAWPDLLLPMTHPKVIETMISFSVRRVNDLYSSYGPEKPWPMEGLHHDWLCDYCPVGPKYERTCLAWQT